MTHPGTSLLTQIAAQLGPGNIVQKPNDNEVEWRGSVYDLPARLKLDSFLDLEGMVKFSNGHGTVDLNWDPEYVNEPPVEPFSEDDQARVFVAKNVCIETFQWGIEDEIQGFRALPAEPMSYLLVAMPRDGVARVYIRRDEFEFGLKEHLNETPDPVGSVVRFTQLVGWCCANWQAAAPAPAAAAQAGVAQMAAAAGGGVAARGPAYKMKCEYCRCTFLLDASARCPNCGAAAQG